MPITRSNRVASRANRGKAKKPARAVPKATSKAETLGARPAGKRLRPPPTNPQAHRGARSRILKAVRNASRRANVRRQASRRS